MIQSELETVNATLRALLVAGPDSPRTRHLGTVTTKFRNNATTQGLQRLEPELWRLGPDLQGGVPIGELDRPVISSGRIDKSLALSAPFP